MRACLVPTMPVPALRLVTCANHDTIPRALSARERARFRMKIVKLEDFHADGGWDTYSFLKITTDEGLLRLVGVQREPSSRDDRADPRPGGDPDRPGSARDRQDRGIALRHFAADGGRALVPCHRRDRERLPRHQGQGARACRCTSCWGAPCATACRSTGRAAGCCGPAVPTCSTAGRSTGRRCAASTTSRAPRARRASAASRRSRPTCCCSTKRAAGCSRRA